MTDKPIKPPIDGDADLRDFPFMPLDVRRLTRSDLMWSITGDEFRAAVALWCEAWQQVPAGSLPNDDRVLAGLAGLGRGPTAMAEWQALREGALRGFELATDGRLYHPVIIEKAVEAWRRKQEAATARAAHAERMKRWREQKTKPTQGDNDSNVSQNDHEQERDDHVSGSRDDHVTPLIGTGTGTGTGNKEHSLDHPAGDRDGGPARPKKPKPITYPADFEAFWAIYPRKVGKVEAAKAFAKAKGMIGHEDAAGVICAAATAYRTRMRGKDEQYVAHPSTWLHQGRWDDIEASPAADTPVWKRGANQFGAGG